MKLYCTTCDDSRYNPGFNKEFYCYKCGDKLVKEKPRCECGNYVISDCYCTKCGKFNNRIDNPSYKGILIKDMYDYWQAFHK